MAKFITTPKYSKTPFDEYTYRFRVEFVTKDLISHQMDIYSDSSRFSKIHDMISEKKSEEVVEYYIKARFSKEDDEAIGKMLDSL